MSMNDTLDTLEELVEKSWTLPMSGGKCVVDAERVLQLLGEIRTNIPEEIKQAQRIVEDRRAILQQANEDAEKIIRKAEDQAAAMTQQEAVYQNAKTESEKLLQEAQDQAKAVRSAAARFVEQRLAETDKVLQANLNDIQSLRNQLKGKMPGEASEEN